MRLRLEAGGEAVDDQIDRIPPSGSRRRRFDAPAFLLGFISNVFVSTTNMPSGIASRIQPHWSADRPREKWEVWPGPSPFTPPPDCRYTARGDRLYLHVFAWPFRHLHLPGLAGRVRFAQLLHDGSEVGFEVVDPARKAQNTTMAGLGPDVVTLNLPVRRPDVAVPVVELFLD